MRILEEKTRKYIDKLGLLSKRDRLLVALSGGADSVCMLLVMHELGYEIGAAHCNFHLRGAESDRDEQFVRDLCTRLGIDLYVEQFDTTGYSESKGMSIEMAARDLRYDYFNRLLKEKKFTKICIAHHGDDSVETFFINLFRGSGIRGLCGIPVKNGRIVRPLLFSSREEIMDYLLERGEGYVTDSTNLQTEYLRNKIRLEVLPLLERISPSSIENIHTTIQNLREDNKIYSWCIGRMEEESSFVKDGMLYVSKEALQRSPSPLSLLHEIMRECGYNRSQLIQIISSMDNTGKVFYSKDYQLTIDRDYLIVSGYEEDVKEPLSLTIESEEGEWALPFGTTLRYKITSSDGLRFNKSADYAYFDLDKIGSSIKARLTIQGDNFKPYGMQGRKLVSDLLTDMKKNKFEKDRQMVLESGGKIAWVIGVRSSEEFKVYEGTNKVVVVYKE